MNDDQKLQFAIKFAQMDLKALREGDLLNLLDDFETFIQPPGGLVHAPDKGSAIGDWMGWREGGLPGRDFEKWARERKEYAELKPATLEGMKRLWKDLDTKEGASRYDEKYSQAIGDYWNFKEDVRRACLEELEDLRKEFQQIFSLFPVERQLLLLENAKKEDSEDPWRLLHIETSLNLRFSASGYPNAVEIVIQGSARSIILHQLFLLLQNSQNALRIRVCKDPDCGRIFLKIRRQIYCSKRCAMREFMKRYRSTESGRLHVAGVNRKQYEKRVRAETRAKVKIATRRVRANTVLTTQEKTRQTRKGEKEKGIAASSLDRRKIESDKE